MEQLISGLQFIPTAFVEHLPCMAWGMGAIFGVMGILILATAATNHLLRK